MSCARAAKSTDVEFERGRVGQTKVHRYWPGRAPEWEETARVDDDAAAPAVCDVDEDVRGLGGTVRGAEGGDAEGGAEEEGAGVEEKQASSCTSVTPRAFPACSHDVASLQPKVSAGAVWLGWRRRMPAC